MAASFFVFLSLAVLLATWTRSVFGISIEIYPPSPGVNETVTLNVIDVRGTLLYADWYKGKNTSAEFQIIRFNRNAPKNFGKRYFTEADVFENGSLQISNVQKIHEGFYTVNVQTEMPLQDATVLLTLKGADSTGGLGSGAIAGIAIAVIAVVLGLSGIIVYVLMKKNKSSDPAK
ncbi:carcinoembryonic antigen-related cell adhesion molecule 1-like isoform X2 [Bufo bufo]|uniref:carcinoembryonic antigen-related cell adhesion molecule 1-like isoform X2 n=1 Tax=Bufo bufo TaxID=8384 RepID=UPI001ABEB378|nr:carcinoembryonic antigen-related cell adhesion molecule 1-like isoform X2 [Bufo bufo]